MDRLTIWNGAPRDPATAVRWFRSGSDLVDAVAMYQLGRAYEGGHGVKRDRRAAVEWYRKAASLGLPDALERLETMAEAPQR
jgi:TPR repeat protein